MDGQKKGQKDQKLKSDYELAIEEKEKERERETPGKKVKLKSLTHQDSSYEMSQPQSKKHGQLNDTSEYRLKDRLSKYDNPMSEMVNKWDKHRNTKNREFEKQKEANSAN